MAAQKRFNFDFLAILYKKKVPHLKVKFDFYIFVLIGSMFFSISSLETIDVTFICKRSMLSFMNDLLWDVYQSRHVLNQYCITYLDVL